MAHKTLVNSTAYDITGGKTLVDGTSYSVNNGKVLIDGTEHDISFLLPSAALDLWSDSGHNTITCIIYANGYYVVGGQYAIGTTGSEHYGRIAYATSLDGPWTIKDVWAGNDSIVTSIAYANNYWVVCGRMYGNNSYRTAIGWSVNLTGEWNIKTLWSDSYTGNIINCITYADGYWVVGGELDTGGTRFARIAYATHINSSWSTKILWNSSEESAINGITYADGYWVAVGRQNGYTARLAYATTPSQSEWNTVDLWSNSSSYTGNQLTGVTYANGYWVVCGKYSTGNPWYGRIAYTTSLGPERNWTIKDVWTSYYSEGGINSITYDKDHWVVAGYKRNEYSNEGAYIAHATSLDGPWTEQELWLTNDNNHLVEANCVAYLNGYWVVGGERYDGSVGSGLYYARLEYSASLEGFNDI
jgi:hypothetical protein